MKCTDILSRMAAPLLVALLLGGCLPVPQGDQDEEREPQFLEGKSKVSALDYRGAIESFEKATQVNPRNGKAHYELGWLFDQQEKDAAAAIYHYERYLKLRPGAPNAETVRDRVVACKQELARTVSFGPVMISTEGELQQLREERARLIEALRVATNTPPLVQVLDNTPRSPVGTGSTPSPTTSASIPRTPVRTTRPQVGTGSTPSPITSARTLRTHTVAAGENPVVIARKYGVKLDALLRANPGLNPRKLKVGQAVKIP
jgi:LysM repeat protein